MPEILELKTMVLEETKTQLKMNRSMLEMLEDNTPLEDLARLRDEWVDPLERLAKELQEDTP